MKLRAPQNITPAGFRGSTRRDNRQDASKSVQDNINTEDLILVIVRSKCERRVTGRRRASQALSRLFLLSPGTFRNRQNSQLAVTPFQRTWPANRTKKHPRCIYVESERVEIPEAE